LENRLVIFHFIKSVGLCSLEQIFVGAKKPNIKKALTPDPKYGLKKILAYK